MGNLSTPLRATAKSIRSKIAKWIPKFRKQGDKPLQNLNPNTPTSQLGVNSSPASQLPAVSIPTPLAESWLRAEQRLRKDKNMTKLLDEYENIIALELNADLKTFRSLDQHEELVQVLESKTKELESKKLSVLLGCSPGFEERATRVLNNVLATKDLVNAGVSAASPFAGIACGGVTVILTASKSLLSSHLYIANAALALYPICYSTTKSFRGHRTYFCSAQTTRFH
jgi:hypothetical protein